ncbi:unnamed protein product [Protopolystoma xenopodis]|uniref:Uncharacterized protein n=1 Tax=Protopolystoma xenopodis TaxID=117903 RepID=A0A448XQ12_9PLAT|nr:unnamed protein product [Protopolystoma xenopodis]
MPAKRLGMYQVLGPTQGIVIAAIADGFGQGLEGSARSGGTTVLEGTTHLFDRHPQNNAPQWGQPAEDIRPALVSETLKVALDGWALRGLAMQ